MYDRFLGVCIYRSSVDRVNVYFFNSIFDIEKHAKKKHKRKRESMNKISFEIVDDAVIKYTPMPEIRENVYKTEVVMTKEIFQECYKKWIMSQESEEKA